MNPMSTTESCDELRPLWMEIRLEDLAHNFAEVSARSGGKQVIASIKGDAYGFGAVQAAKIFTAQGTQMLATASVRDAGLIRAAGIATPILIFGGVHPGGLPEVVKRGFRPTLCDAQSARALPSQPSGAPAPVFVKVDAGYGRLGIPIEDAFGDIKSIAACSALEVEGIYTHLPLHSLADAPWARDALASFADLLQRLADVGIVPRYTQALASAGVEAGLEDRSNAISPGHSLYGISPLSDVGRGSYRSPLRRMCTRLIAVNRFDAPRRVGSGGTQHLAANSAIGVLALGFADGFPRMSEGSQLAVRVGDAYAPVRAVSLEHVTVDLSACPDAAAGDLVTIIDREDPRLTLESVAEGLRIRPLDLVMNFSGRVARRYV